MKPRMNNVRALAWNCLQRWAKGGVFAESLVNHAAKEQALSPADRALLQAIVYETLRHLSYLDHLRKRLRDAPLEENLRYLVLEGLCQLFILKQADHAAVSETVALAPARARGVVNAMLRNATRRRAEFEAELPTLPLSLRYSCPSWLVKRFIAEFGEEETEAMLAWNGQVPPLYARINPVNPPQEIPDDWLPVEGVEGWYRLRRLPMEQLKAGQVYMADLSTRHCIRLLNPQQGEKILDACAAPGGKSSAIIGATMGEVRLLATDLEEHRLRPLRENLLKAGARDLELAEHDWTKPCPPEWRGAFDAVLLDVPCSNSGVLQRRVDARWRLKEEEFSRLCALQMKILEQGCQAVRPGGRLVYSTCSVDAAEDGKLVRAFVAAHPDFRLQEEYLALPHREKADGAYAALLLRKENF